MFRVRAAAAAAIAIRIPPGGETEPPCTPCLAKQPHTHPRSGANPHPSVSATDARHLAKLSELWRRKELGSLSEMRHVGMHRSAEIGLHPISEIGRIGIAPGARGRRA